MAIDIRKLKTDSESSIKEAMRVIDKNGLGLVLVTDKRKKFCGLATDGDVRRAVLAGCGWKTRIKDVMQKNPVVVRAGTDKEEILKLMSSKIRHIPILDENNKIINLASYAHFFHIPVTEPEIEGKELEYVTDCIATGWVSSGGKYVKLFEDNFSEFCQTKYSIAVSNGTAALHLALAVLGVGKGDEVIVPTLSFIATANAVSYTGAKPVFVDVQKDTWNIDPEKIKDAITSRTKAIIPVHLYGHPADMDPILSLAKKHKLYVIEDAAEAHGAEYKGKKVGSFPDVGCFSFFGNKIITTGEGGMITTNNPDIAQKAIILRDHGMSREKKYWHPYIGFNYRLTNIQAAIGVAQLEKIASLIKRKRENARLYSCLLKGVKGIVLPVEKKWAKSVYWMYSILVEDSYGISRDLLMRKLSERGIDTRPVFYPIHIMPPYADNKKFPIAEEISRKGISLPSAVSLKEDEIRRIAAAIKEIGRGRGKRC
ncbi:MAG: aminotransferase class I/II-fold pyridoxal phosphate-dependent enzyme [Candidatus Omnitrophica bacterium]|nr:aminotransferase class I/II-fold pyridoxal phosphate-dependent enzyme [Candidatus Omnitrophota bacterium]